MVDVYKSGTHAVRNALTCLCAIRNAVDNGAISLIHNGEAPGNYSHVCDAIEWLKKHPQAVEVVRAGPPTPRPVAGLTPNGKFIGQMNVERNGSKYRVMMWTGDGWADVSPMIAPLYEIGDADNYANLLRRNIWLSREGFIPSDDPLASRCTMPAHDSPPVTTDAPVCTVTPPDDSRPGSSSTDYRYWTPPTDSDGKEIPVGPDFIYFRLCRDEQHGYFFDRWYPDHDGRWRWFQCNMAPDRDIHRELNHGAYTIERALEKWKAFRENKAVYLVSSRCQPDGETVWERHNVTPVTLAADTNIPEHDGTFRIMPNVLKPDDGWSIRQWDNKKWASLSLLGTFPDYWSAVDRVKEAARLRSEATYLVTPSEREIEYWAGAGFTIKAPPAPGVFSPFYNPAMVKPITTAAQEILEIIKDGAARELKIPPVPAPEIGTKIPVPLESGYWAIDEWTATGWNRVADDLDWEEVEDKLRPAAGAAPADAPAIGTCEIRPGSMPGDIWDVFQWTGRSWKEIAGNVTKRTAEGVVRARAMDPENPVATPLASTVVKSYRRIVKTVRNDLVSLDGDIRSWLASPKPTLPPDELLKQISNQIERLVKSIEDGISVHA